MSVHIHPNFTDTILHGQNHVRGRQSCGQAYVRIIHGQKNFLGQNHVRSIPSHGQENVRVNTINHGHDNVHYGGGHGHVREHPNFTDKHLTTDTILHGQNHVRSIQAHGQEYVRVNRRTQSCPPHIRLRTRI